jgi:hypothetical protein
MLPPPGQVGIRDLREEKCQGKENGRKEVLASMVPSPSADMNWITVALQEKSKQSTVTTMMQQVHNQYQTIIATKTAEAKTTNASKKRKAKPKKADEKNTSRPAEKQFYKIHHIHHRLPRRRPSVCVVANMGISVRSKVFQRQWKRITAVQTSS